MKLIEGETYRVKPFALEPWMSELCDVYAHTNIVLSRIESDGIHIFSVEGSKHSICLSEHRVEWYDEQSAMREVVNEPVAESETEWRLPAGTFFRVNGKHEPLYLVMSNSHVFNLTAKQMHTTCSSRFKDKQLSVANVQMSEVL